MNSTHQFKNLSSSGTGLYFHIPWCRQVCHYCDFAKTANHSDELRRHFITALESQTRTWLRWKETVGLQAFSSVFFGGGTPSIYTSEYEGIMSLVKTHLQPGAEITLEANPDDVSLTSLKVWRDLGFNRISLGVQTFNLTGLQTMHRVHSAHEAIQAIEAALTIFPTLNIDLIYGWLNQSEANWSDDLNLATALGVPHLSLYNLTYEPRTVIGRMAARGKITPADDERLENYYTMARQILGAAGFEHEEVSNWSRSGHSCSHNWLYWSDRSYIGIGPGAHGYIEGPTDIGSRYAYSRNERLFKPVDVAANHDCTIPISEGTELESDRTMESWIIECVSASLRTNRGVDLRYIERKSGRKFTPIAKVTEALGRGLLHLSPCGGFLFATPAEWFRENFWALAVIEGF